VLLTAGCGSSGGDKIFRDPTGGQHRFVFRARRAGRAVIRLRKFFRGKPREQRNVTVEVK